MLDFGLVCSPGHPEHRCIIIITSYGAMCFTAPQVSERKPFEGPNVGLLISKFKLVCSHS